MAQLHIPYSNLFTARPQQTPKYRRTPVASASAFYLLMAGRNCFQWQRCYLLVVRQSGVAVCVGSRWEEARWPLSPALISYSFVEINDSCAITLRQTWRGPGGVWKPHVEFFLLSLVENPFWALTRVVKGYVVLFLSHSVAPFSVILQHCSLGLSMHYVHYFEYFLWPHAYAHTASH